MRPQLKASYLLLIFLRSCYFTVHKSIISWIQLHFAFKNIQYLSINFHLCYQLKHMRQTFVAKRTVLFLLFETIYFGYVMSSKFLSAEYMSDKLEWSSISWISKLFSSSVWGPIGPKILMRVVGSSVQGFINGRAQAFDIYPIRQGTHTWRFINSEWNLGTIELVFDKFKYRSMEICPILLCHVL